MNGDLVVSLFVAPAGWCDYREPRPARCRVERGNDIMKSAFKFAIAAGTLAVVAMPAQAATANGTYGVFVSEGVTNGAGIDVAKGNPFSGQNTGSANFTYTGSIDFSNTNTQNNTPPGPLGDLNSSFGFSTSNISGYTGSGTVSYNGTQVADFTNVNTFLASSGSTSGQRYASYYVFSLGQLAQGTVLSITSDDGSAVFQNGAQVGNTISGPTGVVTQKVTLTNTGDTFLRYGRQNGTPSVLKVDVDLTGAVPEPATWMTMILGFGVVGAAMRRRKVANPQLV